MTVAFIPADPADLALFLRERRAYEDHTQVDLSTALGTVQSAISDWESGETEPTLGNAMAWANALGYRIALEPFDHDGGA